MSSSDNQNQKHKYKNPNRLEGHEGQLLKTIHKLIAYEHPADSKQMKGMFDVPNKPAIDIPAGSIVMFVGYGSYNPKELSEAKWIDVLYEEKKLTINMDLNQWLRYFVPWPHGAFIEQ